MITPFVSDELFEPNYNANVTFDTNNKIIYIDNVFKNYDDILEIIYNVSVESWKKSSQSKNFIDYYDCRLSFNNVNSYKKDNKFYYDIMNDCYNLNNKEIFFTNAYSLNYFKNKNKGLSNNFQHCPHKDDAFNLIFYLDTVANGGTAIYENTNIENREADNIFYDISNLKIEYIIKSKPNRAAIFYGDKLHGGYINDHDVYNYNWRINLVNFIRGNCNE